MTTNDDPLRDLLNEAAPFGMLLRIYQSDPRMNEGTRALMRNVFATYSPERDDWRGGPPK
jgi:hypothetical protein